MSDGPKLYGGDGRRLETFTIPVPNADDGPFVFALIGTPSLDAIRQIVREELKAALPNPLDAPE